MKYNYFILDKARILTTDYLIDTELNSAYLLFTKKQDEFYAEHPYASYSEIVNCKINDGPDPMSLDEVKDYAKKHLSKLSLTTLSKYVFEYQLANAQTSLFELSIDPEASTIYDEVHAKEVIKKYNSIGNDLRNIYKVAEDCINNCENNDDVNYFKNYYTNVYYNYEYNDNEEE